jgi:DNA polymerase III alpha subunit
MITDQYSNPLFQSADIIEMIYQDYIDQIGTIQIDPNIEHASALLELGCSYPIDSVLSIGEYDAIERDRWFMPDEYRNFDIRAYCLSNCTSESERMRTEHELATYAQLNMFPLLQMLKYIVDTLRENSVVWGVGRGSSVASFVLYLLGVHKINSITYELPFNEFVKSS